MPMVLFLALYVAQLAKNSELQIRVLQFHPAKKAVLPPLVTSAAARSEAGKQLLLLLASLQDN
ncbi:hypothetical protein AWB76_07737 [Caballeronia temeraria]|uniref:Uncharacterized protein n=1 Tax=Caballeronia temeraria TaxID=1777137 RepID=A0A158DY99_9BURK|nr:hypothetical protein [Caballeronia temeraria]SAK99534.1 hypothetical protein AWB76_07737 [Caballeronia temeraria]